MTKSLREKTSQYSINCLVTMQHFFFVALALCSCTGFSLVAASGSSSLIVVRGLLTVIASLVAEHVP